ncbi:glycosyltransferase [Deinococcus aquaticus]|uniref:glycosyltransferase n=1 Tax=Deinococcus aquaticus TaxID=328692 RepID=UPI003F466328
MTNSVTIIIATFNSEKYIEQCIESCLSQHGVDVQIILVDGFSKDKTVHLASKLLRGDDIIICQPDSGVYDAWNKALPYIRNKWTLFRGSDDVFVDNTCLLDILRYANSVDADLVFGNTIKVDSNLDKLSKLKTSANFSNIMHEMSVPHPSLFHRSTLFSSRSYKFSLDYKIVSDYHMLMKMYLSNISISHLDRDITFMREGGISNIYDLEGHLETLNARKELGYYLPTPKTSYLIFRAAFRRYLKPLILNKNAK